MPPSQLQHELKRKQPFESVEQEALLNLLRTSDLFENRLIRFFREHDLTLSQFNVLRILQVEGRPMTCGEIGSRMIQLVPAITGLVDRLHQHGLVERERCTVDRRVVYVSITKKGAELADKVYRPLLDLEQQLLQPLSRVETKEFIRLLEKVRQSVTGSAPS